MHHVDIQVSIAGLRNLRSVPLCLLHTRFVKVLHTIMQGRGREGMIRLYAQAPAGGISLPPPPHIRLCTSLLRTDIGIELLVGSLFVDTDTL
jgi:hypothetical protein